DAEERIQGREILGRELEDALVITDGSVAIAALFEVKIGELKEDGALCLGIVFSGEASLGEFDRLIVAFLEDVETFELAEGLGIRSVEIEGLLEHVDRLGTSAERRLLKTRHPNPRSDAVRIGLGEIEATIDELTQIIPAFGLLVELFEC